MKLTDAKALAEILIEEHLGSGWTFKFNKRKRAFGVCDHRAKTIELSSILTAIEIEDAIEQTILHEIAHAKTPGSGHNKLWKMVARSLGVRNPRSTRDHTSNEDERPEPTWVMIYKTKVVAKYHRRPNRRTFATLHQRYLRGRPETRGQLEIVPYASYLKIK